MRGMILSIRKELMVWEEEDSKKMQGMMIGKVKYGKGSIRMAGVYINGDMERKSEEMREWMEGKEDGVGMIIGGDFNARTEREGRRISWEEWEEEKEFER